MPEALILAVPAHTHEWGRIRMKIKRKETNKIKAKKRWGL